MAGTGRIRNQGMGGFLNPPNHPEHTQSVEGGGYSMSLSEAVKPSSDWLKATTVKRAKALLDSWEPLPINHEDTITWIHQILGYFKDCYKGNGENPWDTSNIRILPRKDPMWFSWYDRHVGVHFIRMYYPEYKPTDNDFANAKWGI